MTEQERVALGSAGPAAASMAGVPGSGRVWLLQPARGRTGEAAMAIAERLNVEFDRMALDWGPAAGLGVFSRRGTLLGLRTRFPAGAAFPAVTVSCGRAGARVAAWVKRHAGSLMVHYGAAGLVAGVIDLHVLDRTAHAAPAVMPVLGEPHGISPVLLATTALRWRERLDHLPQPRLALFVGGAGGGLELPPQAAFQAARSIAAAVAGAKGAVLAVAEASLGREATDALAEGLKDCLHLVHRVGEPEPQTALGFLSCADAVVVAGHAPDRLLRACATGVPVYVLPLATIRLGLGCPLQRRLIDAGQVRLLEGRIDYWKRPALDEAGRVAKRIHEMVSLEV